MRSTFFDEDGCITYQYFDKGNTLFLKLLKDGTCQLEFDNLLSKLFSTEELMELKEELLPHIIETPPWQLPDINQPLYINSVTEDEYISIMRGKSDEYELQLRLGTKQDATGTEQIIITKEALHLIYYYVVQLLDDYITNEYL